MSHVFRKRFFWYMVTPVILFSLNSQVQVLSSIGKTIVSPRRRHFHGFRQLGVTFVRGQFQQTVARTRCWQRIFSSVSGTMNFKPTQWIFLSIQLLKTKHWWNPGTRPKFQYIGMPSGISLFHPFPKPFDGLGGRGHRIDFVGHFVLTRVFPVLHVDLFLATNDGLQFFRGKFQIETGWKHGQHAFHDPPKTVHTTIQQMGTGKMLGVLVFVGIGDFCRCTVFNQRSLQRICF